MAKSIFGTVSLFLLLLLLLLTPRAQGVQFSNSEISAKFESWRLSIESLHIEGELVGTTVANSPDRLNRSRQLYSAAADYRFFESQHLINGFSWDDDLGWIQVSLRPGELRILSVLNRVCELSKEYSEVSRNPKLLDTYNGFYLQCTGWWPEEKTMSDDELRRMLANPLHLVLRDKDAIVLPQQSVIGGSRCTVLIVNDKETTNKIWLDMNRGGVVVQRSQSNSKNSTHSVIYNSRFKEVIPGTWLPLEVSRIVHRGERALMTPPRQDVLSKATLSIDRVTVNSLTNEDFRIVDPPGTITVNVDNGDITTTPNGIDMLEGIIKVANKIVKNDSVVGRSVGKYKGDLVLLIIALAGGCIVQAALSHRVSQN